MRSISAALSLLIAISGCDQTPQSQQTPADSSVVTELAAWAEFRDNFIERYFEFNPTAAVWAGRHEFDGQLDDFAPSAVSREIAWLREQRAIAEGFGLATLPAEVLFERDHLIAVIDGELFYKEDSGFLQENAVEYALGLDPSVYLTRDYAPLDVRFAAFTKHLEAVPRYLDQMTENLETPLSRTHIEVSKSILEGYVSFFDADVPGIFETVEDAALWEAFEEQNSSALSALNDTLDWLDFQLDTADEGFALGEERFLAMLRMTEGIDVSLETLTAAGQADLERNLAALRKACQEYAPGASLADCVAKADAVKLGGSPVEGARQQLSTLKEFLIDADLVTIPGSEEALVAEAPPYARWNIAFIRIPGPYEQEGLPSTYYIAPPDPSWSEEQQLDYLPGRKPLLYISVHEVWPGHFLHFQHAKRSESPLAQHFRTYSYTEGWAHYAEELMVEAGLDDGSPETRIGQLQWALKRNVRYLSAIGLHTGGMSVEESHAMFVEKAFMDFGNARQQANRGTFDPGYLNYTLGKLLIRRLREDWTKDRGGRDAWKAFHDSFLSYGAPPIPLVRQAMLGPEHESNDVVLP